LAQRNEVAVHPGDPAGAAAASLVQSGLRAVPVVDETGQLVGMLRDVDVLRLLLPDYLGDLTDLSFLPPDLDLGSCNFADACGALVSDALRIDDTCAVDGNEPVLEAVRIMSALALPVLPVVDEARPTGVITSETLLRRIAETSAGLEAP
jgi:CBS domain-containing protein